MTAQPPAGQRLIRRNPSVTRPIGAMIALVATVLVFEIVVANVPEGWRGDWPWRLRLLGIPASASLLAALIALWVGRDPVARPFVPMLRYVSRWTDDPDGLSASAERYRSVSLRNVGPGPAIVAGLSWRVAVAAAPVTTVSTMPELRAVLDGLGAADGIDYAIDNFSAGTALASGEERHYFQATEAFTRKFQTFDAVFELESLLGDRYERVVSLLPRPGASAMVVTARGTAA